jgi:transposase
MLQGYKGHSAPERGLRFLKDPTVLASSLYLKKPERSMALRMVMTVGLLVYAALAYRSRQALGTNQETFADQQGRPVQKPTAQWVFHYCVGIPVLLGVGERPLVLHLKDQHQRLLKLLGAAYEGLYV